jgi:hypothetical protein
MIDNTGLQSTGLALEGYGRGEVDVLEMLQLTTFIVFAEQIATGGYEVETVTRKTREVGDRLSAFGLEQDFIYQSFVTPNHFASICETAALDCSEDLFYEFQPKKESVGGLYPAALQLQELNVRFPMISRLISREMSEQELAVYRREALDMKKAGAVAYMIASCLELRETVRQVLTAHELSADLINQLDAFCRLYLNSVLASQQGSIYSPAIARARLIRRNYSSPIATLSTAFDNVTAQLKTEPLHLPSVAAYLVLKAKGEPKAVIQEAIELREKTHELRQWLTRLTEMSISESPDQRSEASNEVKEFISLLEKELRLKPAPKFSDALEISFILGLPAPELSGAKLIEWIKFCWKKRKVAVLTDLSKSVVRKCSLDKSKT